MKIPGTTQCIETENKEIVFMMWSTISKQALAELMREAKGLGKRINVVNCTIVDGTVYGKEDIR